MAGAELARPDEEEEAVLVAVLLDDRDRRGELLPADCRCEREGGGERVRAIGWGSGDGDDGRAARLRRKRDRALRTPSLARGALDEEGDVPAPEGLTLSQVAAGDPLSIVKDAVLAVEIGHARERAVELELRVLSREALVQAEDDVVLGAADRDAGTCGDGKDLLLREPGVHHEGQHSDPKTVPRLGLAFFAGLFPCRGG